MFVFYGGILTGLVISFCLLKLTRVQIAMIVVDVCGFTWRYLNAGENCAMLKRLSGMDNEGMINAVAFHIITPASATF